MIYRKEYRLSFRLLVLSLQFQQLLLLPWLLFLLLPWLVLCQFLLVFELHGSKNWNNVSIWISFAWPLGSPRADSEIYQNLQLIVCVIKKEPYHEIEVHGLVRVLKVATDISKIETGSLENHLFLGISSESNHCNGKSPLVTVLQKDLLKVSLSKWRI